jgi:hypothetical protein
LDWRSQLIADLGGDKTITAQQRVIVELATRTRLYVDHLDAVLMGRSSLVTRRGRAIPLVEQRQRLVYSLARLLGQLGLHRVAQRVPSLREILTERGNGTAGENAKDGPRREEPGAPTVDMGSPVETVLGANPPRQTGGEGEPAGPEAEGPPL